MPVTTKNTSRTNMLGGGNVPAEDNVLKGRSGNRPICHRKHQQPISQIVLLLNFPCILLVSHLMLLTRTYSAQADNDGQHLLLLLGP